jgi:hypothetical protein
MSSRGTEEELRVVESTVSTHKEESGVGRAQHATGMCVSESTSHL